MGLLKAGIGALGGVLADQWRDYFYCESMDTSVLVTKGYKRVTKRSSNTKGDENIISNGSIIAVNEGQCMMIVDQGKIVDFCAQPGEYLFEQNGEPSLFYGGLAGENVKQILKTTFDRLSFGGQAGIDQRVYFFNTKEIVGNKYGTPSPVPFRVVDKNIGLDIDISIRCNGEFSYKITDPVLFYTNVSGNVADVYTRDRIDSMLKSELLTALQPAFAKISAMGVRYSALPGHTTEISEALNEVLSKKWSDLRGISVASFAVNTVNASKEDEDLIKNLQKSAVMRDPTMAAATLVGAQSDAMRAAAANEGGAMTGFMGLGMAQQSGGMNAQNLFAMGQQQNQNAQQQSADQPAKEGWNCSCGAVNRGKFCAECGAPRPAGAPLYVCDKCGWLPPDPKNPPKFCPECGDRFDEKDVKK